MEVGKRIREIDQQLKDLLDLAQKTPLQNEQKDLKNRQRQHEDSAKAAQREGDGIYWPIYNLDIKNPHSKEALELIPPKELLASISIKEQNVIQLIAEIEALVSEPE